MWAYRLYFNNYIISEGLYRFFMGRPKGRPIKPDAKKKKAVSISISPFELEILNNIAAMDNISRSEVISGLIQSAGFLKAGIIDGHETKPHIGHQKYKLKKSGLYACNPHSLKGVCKHSACEAAYRQEGLL